LLDPECGVDFPAPSGDAADILPFGRPLRPGSPAAQGSCRFVGFVAEPGLPLCAKAAALARSAIKRKAGKTRFMSHSILDEHRIEMWAARRNAHSPTARLTSINTVCRGAP
jgi:hypothetical protein